MKDRKTSMIEIKLANESKAVVLALLARVSYVESHGHFIEDKNDLLAYTNQAFSVAKTKEELNDSKNLFYIIYADELPVGYVKLGMDTTHQNIASDNNVKLERIYILKDFIPLKLGQKLMEFVETTAKKLAKDTIWLTTYIKNNRAIRFYQKNNFKNVGAIDFLVNGKNYENIVFSKSI